MAGPIPEEVIAEVLGRASIVELVGEHVPLKKIGSNYQGLCPFHSDSKPSFHVNEGRQFFHCFGCGAGGNAFHFLMRLQHMTFPEAVRALAAKVGVEIPERSLPPDERRRRDRVEALGEANELAGVFFREMLASPAGEPARRYLRRRDIAPEVQAVFGLGFAPPGWRNLVDHLRRRSVPLALAEAAGLVIPGKDGGYYDRFRGRLVFPIHDEAGRVIGFGARSLGEELPKYINSPESPLFSKGKILYGLHLARGAIREADAALVVEGYTDLIGLYQSGIRNAVATLGTALTAEHLQRLRRYTPHVIHVFDADEAGERATLRALDLCLETAVWGRVLRLPPGHDPDSYVRKVGGEAFGRELRGAVPLMDYWFERVLARTDLRGPEGKIRALGEIVPRIRRLPDPVAWDHYAALLAERLRISERRIHEMLRQGARRPAEAGSAAKRPEQRHQAERLLIQALLKDPSLAMGLEAKILEEMEDPSYRALGALVVQWVRQGGAAGHGALETTVQEPELAQRLSHLLAHMDEVGEDPGAVLHGCVRHLRKKAMERQMRAVQEAMARAREQRDEESLRRLEGRMRDLLQEKARLKLSA